MIELRNINKIYTINKKANINVQALKDISLVFHDCGITTIYGKSGSGKTTILNILGGLDKPTSGNIFYNGEDINQYDRFESDDYRNQCIGFIFQGYNLLNEYNVIDNIKIGLRIQEKDENLINEKAHEALKEVGLEGLEKRKINSLSGGQQQRVAIARALAKDSRILLCDEPTGNLDSNTSEEILKLFKKISKYRLVILITHDQDIARKYSDRIIKLKDGKVEKDDSLTNNISEDKNTTDRIRLYQGFTFKDSLIMIKDNIKHSLSLSIVIIILLVSAFSLTTLFGSLISYNSQIAYINTLEHNEQYVVQITKYLDRPIIAVINGEEQIVHGPQLYYEGVSETDIPILNDLVNNQATFYPSYFFNKTFQDFTDEIIDIPDNAFFYIAKGFREAISVDDFSTFNMELLYGSLPTNDSDVLLYDYMVYSLIQCGVISGTIEDNVGTVIVDQQTHLEMRIKGILKSDYENYAYILEDTTAHNFEETYLTSLQSIFCKPSFIDLVVLEKNIKSVFQTKILHSGLDETVDVLESDVRKLIVESTDHYSFLASIDSYQTQSGIILTKSQVASILGISESNLDIEDLYSFIDSYMIGCVSSFYDFSIERSYNYPMIYQIIGIVDDTIIPDQTYLLYEPDPANLVMVNSDFRQIYLSLGSNWNINEEVLNKFQYVPKTEEFYLENPDFIEQGFVDYNAYGVLIADSDNYLQDVKSFSLDILIPLFITSFVGLVFFGIFTIKKYGYKIGILKALGTRNQDISLIFGLQIVLVGLVSYILSIPISYLLMHEVNYDFVKNIHSGLVFFQINTANLFIGIILSLFLLFVSISIPLILLVRNTPMEIIRNTQRK